MLLREFAEKDTPVLPALLNNENVTRYLSSRLPDPYSLKDAKWWVETGCKEGIVRAIEVNGELAGCIGAYQGQFESSRSMEVGYWLAEFYWGQGIASAALVKFTDLILDTTDAVRLYGQVFGPNEASAKVLKKCGYKKEAVLKKSIYKSGEFYDTQLYVMIR